MRTDFVLTAGDLIEPLRHTVKIALSKRNLLALLHKVDSSESARTLIKDDVIDGVRVRLIVVAEPDEVHYANRDLPGEMHPETEASIREAA